MTGAAASTGVNAAEAVRPSTDSPTHRQPEILPTTRPLLHPLQQELADGTVASGIKV